RAGTQDPIHLLKPHFHVRPAAVTYRDSCTEVAMAWTTNVLVVANVTAASPELHNALVTRAEQGSATFTLIVPATPGAGGVGAARERLDEALAQLSAAGLEIDGQVGNGDAIIAVSDEWDPRRYDEIIISTLPMRLSKWLHAGLPERVERMTGARVTHVV